MPNPAFKGTDTIYYTVCDNEATPNCNTGLQIITVQSPTAPKTVAAGDDYAAVQNGDIQTGSVTRNDYSANGSPLTATAQNTTIDGVGSLVISADGSYSFDPINTFTGPVNFPYQVCDGGDPAACTGATLFFLVTESPQNQVLPAKLVEFSGRNTGALNQLKWVTAIERNTSHFELWHGSNGNQFIPIATIAAAGNSNEVLTYRYDHTTPIAGNNYYRLVTVDKDGRRENSKIINITTRQPGTVHVYPNPTSGMFVLQGDKTELNAIALFNTIGVNITQQAQTLRISDEKIQINITALPNGIYHLRTSTQRFTIVKR